MAKADTIMLINHPLSTWREDGQKQDSTLNCIIPKILGQFEGRGVFKEGGTRFSTDMANPDASDYLENKRGMTVFTSNIMLASVGIASNVTRFIMTKMWILKKII